MTATTMFKRVIRRVRWWSWETRVRFADVPFELDWDRAVQISPRKVNLTLPPSRLPAGDRIQGGDWDRTPNVERFKPAAGSGRTSEPIELAIGRHGDLILVRGQESLYAALASGTPAVSASVVLRHRRWVEFRKMLWHYMRQTPLGNLYHPVTHPDLDDLPARWKEERFDIMRANLVSKGGRLLDIGAHLGFFCHKFEDIGFHCMAVERLSYEAYLLQRLKRAESRRFEVFQGSVFDVPLDKPFEVVLALNVFHHFLKKQPDFERLTQFLETLQTRELFFQSHLEQESQMRNAYRNYPPAEFADWIAKTARLDRVESIGADRGRPIYHLRKS